MLSWLISYGALLDKESIFPISVPDSFFMIAYLSYKKYFLERTPVSLNSFHIWMTLTFQGACFCIFVYTGFVFLSCEQFPHLEPNVSQLVGSHCFHLGINCATVVKVFHEIGANGKIYWFQQIPSPSPCLEIWCLLR